MSLRVPRTRFSFLSELLNVPAVVRGDGPMNGAREPGWPFWIVWVSASVAAGVAAALGLLSFSGLDPAATAFYLAALPLAGVLMALSQWVALRRYVAPGGMWMLATGVGWVLGWPAGISLGAALAGVVEAVPLSGSGGMLAIFVGFVVAGIVPGAVTGALQWRFVLGGPVPVGVVDARQYGRHGRLGAVALVLGDVRWFRPTGRRFRSGDGPLRRDHRVRSAPVVAFSRGRCRPAGQPCWLNGYSLAV